MRKARLDGYPGRESIISLRDMTLSNHVGHTEVVIVLRQEYPTHPILQYIIMRADINN